jgi:hypothetical protein
MLFAASFVVAFIVLFVVVFILGTAPFQFCSQLDACTTWLINCNTFHRICVVV